MSFFDTLLGILTDIGFHPVMILLIIGAITWFLMIHKHIDKIQEDTSKFIHKDTLKHFVNKDLCTMYKKNNALETTLTESLNSNRLDAIEAQMKVMNTRVDKIHTYLVQVSRAKKENKDGR